MKHVFVWSSAARQCHARVTLNQGRAHRSASLRAHITEKGLPRKCQQTAEVTTQVCREGTQAKTAELSHVPGRERRAKAELDRLSTPRRTHDRTPMRHHTSTRLTSLKNYYRGLSRITNLRIMEKRMETTIIGFRVFFGLLNCPLLLGSLEAGDVLKVGKDRDFTKHLLKTPAAPASGFRAA